MIVNFKLIKRITNERRFDLLLQVEAGRNIAHSFWQTRFKVSLKFTNILIVCLPAHSDLNEKLEAERLCDEERERQRQEERDQRRRQQIDEKSRHERADIEQMKIGEDERERLLREHDDNTAKYEISLRQEQERSQAALKG